MNSEKLRRALRPGRLQARVDELTARVDELEGEIRECRQHQHRVAELTDVVQELLLPISQRDQDRVDELLAAGAQRALDPNPRQSFRNRKRGMSDEAPRVRADAEPVGG